MAFVATFVPEGGALALTGSGAVDHLVKIYAANGVVKYDELDAGGNTVVTTTTIDWWEVKTVTISGFGGHDIVDLSSSFGGMDVLDRLIVFGQAGNDVLYAPPREEVNDLDPNMTTLDGGDNDDLIFGNTGWEELIGGSGVDTIWGRAGLDTIYGGPGNDFLLDGGLDADHIEGGTGDDKLRGGPGDDYLFGDEDKDDLDGEADNDRLQGGSENDVLKGGTGRDYLYGDENADTFDGGDGWDNTYSNTNPGDRDQPYNGDGAGIPGSPDMFGSGGADCDIEDGRPEPGCLFVSSGGGGGGEGEGVAFAAIGAMETSSVSPTPDASSAGALGELLARHSLFELTPNGEWRAVQREPSPATPRLETIVAPAKERSRGDFTRIMTSAEKLAPLATKPSDQAADYLFAGLGALEGDDETGDGA